MKPSGTTGERSTTTAPAAGETYAKGDQRLPEKVLERGNLFAALKRVEANRGAGGVDGMTVEELRPYLTPLFDPYFSASSYGFRPGRRAHDAIRAARSYIQAGYKWVVDLDLEEFFDRLLDCPFPMPSCAQRFHRSQCTTVWQTHFFMHSRLSQTGAAHAETRTILFYCLSHSNGR